MTFRRSHNALWDINKQWLPIWVILALRIQIPIIAIVRRHTVARRVVSVQLSATVWLSGYQPCGGAGAVGGSLILHVRGSVEGGVGSVVVVGLLSVVEGTHGTWTHASSVILWNNEYIS